MTSEEIEAMIRQNLAAPASASGETGSVTQHSLRDQLEAARFLASQEALRSGRGLTITRLIPPGATE